MQRGSSALLLLLSSAVLCSCAGNSNAGTASQAGSTGASGGPSNGGQSNSGSGNTAASGGDPIAEGGADARPISYRCVGPCPDGPARPVPSPRPVCPALAPAESTACADSTLSCSYGDSPAAPCRSVYHCQPGSSGRGWVLDRGLQDAYPCNSLPKDYCPPAPPVPLSACTVSSYNTPCVYDSLVCYCGALGGNFQPGSPGKWGCAGPPADPACPALLANLGEGCASSGTECDYADGCLDPPTGNVFCHDGAWELGTPYVCSNK